MARRNMPLVREGFKTCTGCLVEKPLGEFDFEPRVKSQTTAKCRACLRAYKAEWNAANPERVDASREKYRKKYPERVAAAHRFTDRRVRLERLEKRLAEGLRIEPVVIGDTRKCPKCCRRKPGDAFGTNRWCLACNAEDARKRLRSLNAEQREERRKKFRKWDIERRYGVSFADAEQRLLDQGGRCAICCDEIDLLAKRSGCVDHCHTTQEFRGILCVKCNAGLGQFRDNISFMERAIDYLRTRRT